MLVKYDTRILQFTYIENKKKEKKLKEDKNSDKLMRKKNTKGMLYHLLSFFGYYATNTCNIFIYRGSKYTILYKNKSKRIKILLHKWEISLAKNSQNRFISPNRLFRYVITHKNLQIKPKITKFQYIITYIMRISHSRHNIFQYINNEGEKLQCKCNFYF